MTFPFNGSGQHYGTVVNSNETRKVLEISFEPFKTCFLLTTTNGKYFIDGVFCSKWSAETIFWLSVLSVLSCQVKSKRVRPISWIKEFFYICITIFNIVENLTSWDVAKMFPFVGSAWTSVPIFVSFSHLVWFSCPDCVLVWCAASEYTIGTATNLCTTYKLSVLSFSISFLFHNDHDLGRIYLKTFLVTQWFMILWHRTQISGLELGSYLLQSLCFVEGIKNWKDYTVTHDGRK